MRAIMGCAGCSLGAAKNTNGVAGCASSGCSTGGCNRLNTYDWLTGIPAMSWDTDPGFVEVSFKNGARKEIYRKPAALYVEKHDPVAVEVETGGYDIGVVSLTGEMAKLQMKRKRVSESSEKLLNVIRVANDYDIQKAKEARANEKEVMVKARAIARSLHLDMKVGDVEFQGDGRKATFYYTADDRVDFRELIKLYAKEFRVKIEMHQIGARQEAGRIGGIGSCGRELCCSTWLTEFKSVTTAAARYQNLAINQVKLSGQCGRLKCCLNYELDTYIDALKDIPTHVEKIETEKGILFLQKTDIFKKLMAYAYKGGVGYRTLSIEQVRDLEAKNKEGIKVPDTSIVSAAQPDRVKKHGIGEEEIASVDLVGQASLRSLERNSSKRKKKERNQRPSQQSNPRERGSAQGQPGQPPQREPRNANPNQQRNQPPREQRPPNQPRPQNQPRPPQQPREPKPSGDPNPSNRSGSRPPRNDQRNRNQQPRRDRPAHGNGQQNGNPQTNTPPAKPAAPTQENQG